MSDNLLTGIGECMIELSSLNGIDFRKSFAGDVLNTLHYARKALGRDWDVSFYTGLGTDQQSGELTDFLTSKQIKSDQVLRVPDRSPGLYMIHLDGAERSFSYWRDTSAAKLLASDQAHLESVIHGASAIYVSGITLAILPDGDADYLISQLEIARNAGKPVAFDPNIRPRLWADKSIMKETIEKAGRASSIILPSFDDEAGTFGDATPEDTIERYRHEQALVVVKNASASVLANFNNQTIEVATPPVPKPTDTTGAGDSFNGAFLAHYLSHHDVEAAIRAGQACAANVICHQGAIV